MQQNREARATAPSLRLLAFALGVIALTAGFYFLSLTFLFPGFFHPLVPFHVDFYDYTGTAFEPLRLLLTQPRIAAELTMHILGQLGLRGLMAGGIVITLSGIVLTVGLVKRLARPSFLPLLLLTSCYLVLLFGHPQFYFEHRHDLPAEISSLGLLLLLHSGLSWLRTGRPAFFVCAGITSLLFALSKETFFLSAICLVVVLQLQHSKQRARGFGLLALVLFSEAASLAWTHRVNSPFVQLSASASAPYHLDFAPASILRTYWFYLRQLFTPASAIFVVAAPVLMGRSRESVLAVGFLTAGLLALLPHALLPNHAFGEYAWIAAPLLFVPVLLAASSSHDSWHRPLLVFLAIAATGLSFVGRDGYLHRYRDAGQTWALAQEKRSGAFQQSWPRLKELPAGTRVLISGLDTPFLPWASPLFAAHTFGATKEWLVLSPLGAQDPHLPHLRLINLLEGPVPADVIASYDQDGKMVGLRSGKAARLLAADPMQLIPELASAQRAQEAAPHDRMRLLKVIDACLIWGAYDQAAVFLAKADRAGFGRDEWICYMAGKLASARRQWTLAADKFACSVHQSPGTQAFQNALREALHH